MYDATVHDKMNDVLDLFDEIIIREESDLPEGHPIKTYLKENEAGKKTDCRNERRSK